MKKSTAALPLAVLAGAAGVAVADLRQKKHSLLRNFPVVGHFRYLLESIGPELRQYIVTGNDEERPFSRDQRRWVYASSKLENNYFGFGTDNDMEYESGYPIIKHRTFADIAPATHPPKGAPMPIPCAKVMGAARGRAKAFRPASVVNISGMSFGSLSGNAIQALNAGRQARRLPAQHRRGKPVRAPPAGRRPDPADRHVVLRMPRRGRPVQHGPAQADRRQRSRPRHRGQAQPGRQARPRWPAPRRRR